MPPLELIKNEPENHELRDRMVRTIAAQGTTDVQLLCSIILDLTKDVKRLKQKVSDLEGRETV